MIRSTSITLFVEYSILLFTGDSQFSYNGSTAAPETRQLLSRLGVHEMVEIHEWKEVKQE
jgi:hypothetical protein